MNCRCNVVIALGFVVISGCATGGFREVSVSAGDDMEPVPTLAGLSVFVVPNTQMSDSLLEARIRARVEEALLQKGYTIVSAPSAELYVMASFGSVERMGLTTALVVSPPQTRVVRAANGTVVRRVYPESIEHPTVLSPTNSIAVLLSASDAKVFRETGRVRTIWRGEASTPGKADLAQQMVPYLLASTLKYFGKSSGGPQSVDVRDKEIKGWSTAR